MSEAISSAEHGAPKTSLLVPVCNVERYLRECLDSAAAQTLRDIEVICIDDGSSDSSGEILDAYAAEDPRFKVVHKENSGYGDSMNLALGMAAGEYVAILESDDIMEPDALELLVGLADEAGADVAKADFWLYWSRPVPRREVFGIVDPEWTGRVVDPRVEHGIFYRKPSIWSAVYRRVFLQANDIRFLDTLGASYQDAGFNFKVWAAARRVVFSTTQVLSYRQDNEKSSVNSPGKVFCVCDEYAEMRRWLDGRPEISVVLSSVLERMKFDTYMWNFERLAPELRGGFVERASSELAEDIASGMVDFSLFDPAAEADFKLLASDPSRFAELRIRFPGNGKFDTLRRYAATGGASLVAKIVSNKFSSHGGEAPSGEEGEELPAESETPEPPAIEWGDGPMVSVVVPVYNVRDYLPQCLDSLLAQTLERIEIVCVNDGSTDGSREVLAEYAARDRRVKIVDQPNGGLSAARNSGIAAADAPVVAFLDADDAYVPDACRKIVCAFGDTGAEVVTFGAQCVPDSGGDEWLEHHLSPRDAVFSGYSDALIFEEASHPYPRTSCTKAFLEREGLQFDETLRYAEDELFYLSAYPVSRRTALLADKLYLYRVAREGSLTAGVDFGSAETLAKHLDVVERVLARWQELFGDADAGESAAATANVATDAAERTGVVAVTGANAVERRAKIGRILQWSVEYALHGIYCLDGAERDALLAKYGEIVSRIIGTDVLEKVELPAGDREMVEHALSGKGVGSLEAAKLRLKRKAGEVGPAQAAGKAVRTLLGR